MSSVLTDVTAKKVSIVGKAANKRQFLLYKNAEGVSELNHDQLIALLKAEPADAAKILKEAGVPDEVHTEVLKATDLLKPLADTLTKEATAAVIKSLEAIKPAESVITKADFEAIQKKADDAEQAVKILKEDAAKKEFVTKAAGFDSVPTVTPETFGPILKECSEKLSKESYEAIEKMLQSTNEVVKQSALLRNYGTPGYQVIKGSALDQLQEIAKGIIQKDGTLTEQQAFRKACQDNPELWEKHQTELAGNVN